MYIYKFVCEHVYNINFMNKYIVWRQHRKDIDLNLKPFRGNNNINNYIFHT